MISAVDRRGDSDRTSYGVVLLFDDAELEPMPNMLAPVVWQVVTGTIEAAVRELG